MDDLINNINKFEKLITLTFSLLVTISTVVYALLTSKLTKETIRMRKAQTDPKITAYLKINNVSMNFINFIVENIGTGQAYDIKISIIKELDLGECNGRKLRDLGVVQHGMKHMAPKQKIETWYMNLFGIYEKVIEENIELQITYKNELNEIISEDFILNMSQFKNISQIGSDPLQEIADNIEKIEKSISNISNGWKTIKVDIFDNEDRIRMQEKLKERFEKGDPEII